MKKFSFAIIGGGSAAFYTSKLLLRFPCAPVVHIYEKELCPFGLIRYGVAPDHVSIKKSQTRLCEQVTNPNFKYFGNCNISLPGLQQLRDQYSGIIYAYGASQNQIPKWLPSSLPPTIKFSRDIVYWYNGHPSQESQKQNLKNVKNLVIIGNGNAAIDVARVLMRSAQELAKTEISKDALEELMECDVKNVEIVGRRGVTHSAFAVKEVRELKQLGFQLYAVQEELEDSMTPSSQFECTAIADNLNSIVRMNKRKLQFIRQNFTILKQNQIESQKQKQNKKIIFRYLLNPISLTSQNLTCQKMHLQGQPFKQTIIPTSQFTTLNFDMLVLSTGFEVEEFEERHYDFVKRRVNNSDGCVIERTRGQGQIKEKIDIGAYAVGWCKNGGKGVLDQTLLSCQETLNNLRIHMDNGVLKQKQPPMGPSKFVSFDQYSQARQIQLEKGIREKFIKKKLTNKQLKELYGVNDVFTI